MDAPELSKYREEISRCALCAGCQARCPVYEATLDESMSARGKLSLLDAYLKGELDLSNKLEDRIFQCLSCLQCSTACPSGVDPVKIINAARSDIRVQRPSSFFEKFALRRMAASPRLMRLLARPAAFFLRHFIHWLPAKMIFPPAHPGKNGDARKLPEMGRPPLKDLYPEVVGGKSPRMRVLFFTGCMGDMVYPEASAQIIDFLKENGVEVILPRDMACCGAPSYYSGERVAAVEMARRNLEIVQRWNPDYVLHNCATCGLMWKGVYPLLLSPEETRPLAEKMMDIHPFLIEKVIAAKTFPSRRKIKVTYHDPCHLGRGQGVREEPRQLLKSIPWVEFVEMEEADACCGGGGSFSWKYYALSLEIASRKVAAIKKSGAEVVATGCPSCQTHLSDALAKAGLKIPVVHTTQLFLVR